MKLIVGLGNPGSRYAHTRHNVGFMALDAFGSHGPLSWQLHHQAFIIKQADVILAKPQTFMNLSGESAGEIARYYKIPTENILLVYDDIDTEFGKVRYREKGSSGGHNGVKSIAQYLGTEQIQRIKIGVGRPPAHMPAADYVLQAFSPEEQVQLPLILKQAVEKIKKWTLVIFKQAIEKI
jgi:PTH1 family peptidyl-tRNA hydrolase